MKEVIGMIQALLGMGTDTYMKCKYASLAAGREKPETKAFFEVLFEITDRKRPLHIEMKEGGKA